MTIEDELEGTAERALKHEHALIEQRVNEAYRLAESWAKVAREDFLAGRPFSIKPEPRYKHVAELAVQIAFGGPT